MNAIARAMLLVAAILSAAGTVKSVSSSSLVIATRNGKEMTFMLDDHVKLVGKGVGDKMKSGHTTAMDVIGEGDYVIVSYHDMGSMLHAAAVRITGKKQ